MAKSRQYSTETIRETNYADRTPFANTPVQAES